jgi:hypothetical protein
MEITCKAITFASNPLKSILEQELEKHFYITENKRQLFYLQEYLNYLDCQTVILETPYTDRDFLEDFADYYSRCFQDYGRECSRLHFFNLPFNQTAFEQLIAGSSSSITPALLSDHYLGFIVINPLPQGFIGKTCLKTYPCETRRHYPITRKYTAHLMGLSLSVESLAYQEQDQAVSACATSALWSVFHGSGIIFHHSIPSPVQITKTASQHILLNQRPFPNDGLTLFQISHAVKGVGLEPLLVTINDFHVLFANIYAYIKARIPLLLGVELAYIENCLPQRMGLHAVAVTGFSTGDVEATPYKNTDFMIEASKINKIYVHDDQVGPFARMDTTSINRHEYFTTCWPPINGRVVVAKPTTLLIPLYHKIRIPYSKIEEIIVLFDGIVNSLVTIGELVLDDKIIWDIELSTISDLKKEFFTSEAIEPSIRKEVLHRKLPRFIWRAKGNLRTSSQTVLEVFFDATDLELAKLIVYGIDYGNEILQKIKSIDISKPCYDFFNFEEKKIISWISEI